MGDYVRFLAQNKHVKCGSKHTYNSIIGNTFALHAHRATVLGIHK